MNKDYNDVGKLLDHMNLDGFAYRSFRKEESGPAVEAAAVEPAAAETPPAAAEQPAPPPIVAAPPSAPSPPPPAAPKLRVVIPGPQPAPASAAAPVASQAAAPDARIGATLDRLMRGSITDGAPKLHLQLGLPERPSLNETQSAPVPGERSLKDIFGQLHSAVAARPRVVSGKDR